MEENLPAVVEGDSIEIWVQHKYILQALGKISSSETMLGMSGQVSAMKVEPISEEESKSEKVAAEFVIMPMSSPRGAF
jgi:DNA polymerase III sliding clamp (beta) subunit (PCNA family)